jgi:hypothetical protein
MRGSLVVANATMSSTAGTKPSPSPQLKHCVLSKKIAAPQEQRKARIGPHAGANQVPRRRPSISADLPDLPWWEASTVADLSRYLMTL